MSSFTIGDPADRGQRRIPPGDRIVRWGLLALLWVAPLPFASNRTWAVAALALWLALLMFVWAFSRLAYSQTSDPVPLRPFVVPAICFGAVLLWAMVQASTLTPPAWHHPVWRNAAHALQTGDEGFAVSGSISANRYETWSYVLRFLVYGMLFWLVLQNARSKRFVRRLLRTLVYVAAIYSLYGLYEALSGSRQVLFVWQYEAWGGLRSTFRNSNHFATFAGLALLAGMAFAVDRFSHHVGHLESPTARLRSAIHVLTHDLLPVLIALVVIGQAILLTFSRGGLLAIGVGLAAFSLLLARLRSVASLRRTALVLGAALVVVMAALAALALERWEGRWDLEALSRVERPAVFSATVEGIQDRPLLGAGLGAFPEAFSPYRSANFGMMHHQAHNSYLEIAFELGLPAAALLLAAIVSLVWLCARGRGVNARDSVFRTSAVAASALVGAHALVDFSLQIPAVTLSWLALLAVGCARSAAARLEPGAP